MKNQKIILITMGITFSYSYEIEDFMNNLFKQ